MENPAVKANPISQLEKLEEAKQLAYTRRDKAFEGLKHTPVLSNNTQRALMQAFHLMCLDLEGLGVPVEHLVDTPHRVLDAYSDMFRGLLHSPERFLETSFNANGHDELITMDVPHFTSFCAHHLLPFSGWYRFSYLPCKSIVGLSKIPRFIETLCSRPQIQELLTSGIVDLFESVVKPQGCGVIMSATHGCMECRGIRTQGAVTHTTAIRGLFLEKPDLKQEFLKGYRYEVSR